MPSLPFNTTSLSIITGILIYLMWQLNFFVLLSMGYPPGVSFTDSLVNVAMLTIANMAISQTFKYYHPSPAQFWLILVVGAVMAILFTIAAKLLLGVLLSHNPQYLQFLDGSTGLRMMFALLLLECMIILNLLWNMLSREISNRNRQEETLTLAREAELYKLRQQLQPHFLFNSLNSINALVGSQPQEARKMIEQLSTFLRSTINRKEEELVPLEEELDQINRYLAIEKLRFGHRLQTTVTMEENCRDAVLPPLLLQPVVENAIKFGLYDTIDDVMIGIEAACGDGFLEIKVRNPFDASTSGGRKGTGFGLPAVQRRLYLLFGRQDLLVVNSSDDIFTTTIKIPQNYVKGAANR